MSRNPRGIPTRRSNPLRDLVAEKQRATEIAHERQRAEKLKTDLPSIIGDRVDEQIQKLENKLLKDFREMGQRAVEESTNVLNESLNDRIETLEQISAIQSKTIVSLRDSSRIAEEKVSSVVDSIEKTLSNAVPGFRLEPSAFAAPLIDAPAAAPLPPASAGSPARAASQSAAFSQSTTSPSGTSQATTAERYSGQMVKADPQDIEEVKGRVGFCPRCTSTRIRRANRSGILEELLRLFFIAPFRCRACRHKFYRF